MATTSINFYFRPSLRDGRHHGRLYIRLIHARQCKYLYMDHTLYPDEWDAQKRNIIIPSADTMPDYGRQCQLAQISESMSKDLEHLRGIVRRLSERGEYSVSDVIREFMISPEHGTVCSYAAIVGKRLSEQGCERTARAYRSAARSLREFNDGKDTALSMIDASAMKSYEQYLLAKGLKLNTVSFYLRNLRAIYFRAVAEKLIVRQSSNPFAGMHTGVYETRRRALGGEQLKTLARLERVLSQKLETNEKDVDTEAYLKTFRLRDSLLYFMFCYHARGMSFVDMAHLRRQDISKDVILYKRRKTGGILEVKVTDPMKRILSHFGGRTKGSDYVFPIIDASKENTWRQYETGLKHQNRLLKVLGSMAGIEDSLSTHCARHSWATLAKRLNVPVAVIGEALGHRDVKTTLIYLASFDRTIMDELSVKMSKAARGRLSTNRMITKELQAG